MKAVITVTGKDSVGIIARVSALCSEYNANIIDIAPTICDIVGIDCSKKWKGKSLIKKMDF